jgi:hypothetical protein
VNVLSYIISLFVKDTLLEGITTFLWGIYTLVQNIFRIFFIYWLIWRILIFLHILILVRRIYYIIGSILVIIFTPNLLFGINIAKSDLLRIIIIKILFLFILFILKFLLITISLCLHQYLLWESYLLLKCLLLLRRCMKPVSLLFLKIFAIFISNVFLELLLTFEILDKIRLFLCVELRNYDLVSLLGSIILGWLIAYLYMWSLKGSMNIFFIDILILFLSV